MKETAIVMSVKENKAVVLAPGGRFLQIKNREFHVGQRITLEPSLFSLSDRIIFGIERLKEKAERLTERLRYKGLIIITSIAILAPSTAYAATKYVPWTYVSIDTPSASIQYQLNARGEILSTQTSGEEAEQIIGDIAPVRFEKFESTIDRTFGAIYSSRTQDSEETSPLTIGISTRFGNGEDILKTINESSEKPLSADFIVAQINWTETGKAREEELSVGQYGRKYNPAEMNEPSQLENFDPKPDLKTEETLPVLPPALLERELQTPESQNKNEQPQEPDKSQLKNGSSELPNKMFQENKLERSPEPGETKSHPDEPLYDNNRLQSTADLQEVLKPADPESGPDDCKDIPEPIQWNENQAIPPVNSKEPIQQEQTEAVSKPSIRETAAEFPDHSAPIPAESSEQPIVGEPEHREEQLHDNRENPPERR